MITQIAEIKRFIGNTPVKKLNLPESEASLYAKLEYYNLTGSVKDRPAVHIMGKAVENGLINKDTYVVESTSGNFGIALATVCKSIGVRFIPVLDPNTSPEKEKMLKLLSHRIIHVTERDETGGFLLNRIKAVEEFKAKNANTFHPNQYENPNNYGSYSLSLAEEIIRDFPRLDYLFVSVSSGGTIVGLAKRLKQHYPSVKIVPVDVSGSLIFSSMPGIRHIPGLGSGKRCIFLDEVDLEECMILHEEKIVEGCQSLLKEQNLFAGGSSGAVYYAAREYLTAHARAGEKGLIICPDRGNDYINTIYNPAWIEEKYHSEHAVI
ncbi:pyridoxal-phosphate dependent enzyme [Roseivirga sp. BDSF3-8]|uniref:pyridoxal-phosphate dependent enzyme n=1 Tax=Roseivirga sp. BDSF3-8 TaxID=3241598 RepID=UPI003531A911